MPLSEEEKAKLTAAANQRGVDPDKLIAAAERRSNGEAPTVKETTAKSGADKSTASTDKPLYMYHLPFVTVNEVRTIWLGLDPIAGGDEYAAKFAAAQTSAPAKPDVPTS
jgi:hypothetical protein